MVQKIILPKQGLQMTEGYITQWLKKEGDAVKEGEPLFEMETDKLTITIDAAATGTLLKIVHPAGDTVPITETIAYIGDPGEAIPVEEAAPAQAEAPAAAPAQPAKVAPAPIDPNAKLANKVILPKQGLQMTEGYITQWLKKEGDAVKEGEPLFEMETDKLTITIDSGYTGTLLKIVHPAGDTVPITKIIAFIGEPGDVMVGDEDEAAPAAAAPQAEAAPAVAQAQAPAAAAVPGRFATPRAKMRAEEKGYDINAIPATGPDGLIIERDVLSYKPVAASPLARKLAGMEGVDLGAVTGTGARGKIMAEDIRRAASPAAPAAEPQMAAAPAAEAEKDETVVPMTGMRRVIAKKMRESLDIAAQLNHSVQVDMTECVRTREALKAAGMKVSYNDIVIRCVARALKEFPEINATRVDNTIIQKHYVNVGMACATDRGLLVPVVRNADKMSLSEIAATTGDLAKRTKEGTIRPDELTGGTFTVSNLGMMGIDKFVAIINYPEAAILAVGAMKKQPVVLKDDSIAVHPMMWLTLTYDHCITDGAPAARFLVRIKELLENPSLLL